MVVEAHKVFRNRRKKYRLHCEEESQHEEEKKTPEINKDVIDIFNFLSERDDDYSTVIKEIGQSAKERRPSDSINRSKSCSDILDIPTLDHSPRHRRLISASELFIKPKNDANQQKQEKGCPLIPESKGGSEPGDCVGSDSGVNKDSCVFDPEKDGVFFTIPTKDTTTLAEESVQHPGGGGTRFIISKVTVTDLIEKDGKG